MTCHRTQPSPCVMDNRIYFCEVCQQAADDATVILRSKGKHIIEGALQPRVVRGKRDVGVKQTERKCNISMHRTTWSRGHFYSVCITDRTDSRMSQDAQAATALWVGVTATGKASRGSFNSGLHRPVQVAEIIPRKNCKTFLQIAD
jgi:hypothetical protein